jgi:hypothetical protein
MNLAQIREEFKKLKFVGYSKLNKQESVAKLQELLGGAPAAPVVAKVAVPTDINKMNLVQLHNELKRLKVVGYSKLNKAQALAKVKELTKLPSPKLPTPPIIEPKLPSPKLPTPPIIEPKLPTPPKLPSAPILPSLPKLPSEPRLPTPPKLPSEPRLPTPPKLPSEPKLPTPPPRDDLESKSKDELIEILNNQGFKNLSHYKKVDFTDETDLSEQTSTKVSTYSKAALIDLIKKIPCYADPCKTDEVCDIETNKCSKEVPVGIHSIMYGDKQIFGSKDALTKFKNTFNIKNEIQLVVDKQYIRPVPADYEPPKKVEVTKTIPLIPVPPARPAPILPYEDEIEKYMKIMRTISGKDSNSPLSAAAEKLAKLCVGV